MKVVISLAAFVRIVLVALLLGFLAGLVASWGGPVTDVVSALPPDLSTLVFNLNGARS